MGRSIVGAFGGKSGAGSVCRLFHWDGGLLLPSFPRQLAQGRRLHFGSRSRVPGGRCCRPFHPVWGAASNGKLHIAGGTFEPVLRKDSFRSRNPSVGYCCGHHSRPAGRAISMAGAAGRIRRVRDTVSVRADRGGIHFGRLLPAAALGGHIFCRILPVETNHGEGNSSLRHEKPKPFSCGLRPENPSHLSFAPTGADGTAVALFSLINVPKQRQISGWDGLI